MSLIDHQQIDSMSMGSPEILLPILDDFANDAASALPGLRDSCRDEDTTASAIIHRLKGASGSLGLSQFYQQCIRLESAIKDGSFPSQTDLDEFTTLLNDSITQARAHLEA